MTTLFETNLEPELPKITSIAPWFGGKRSMAPDIVAEIGECSAWWEVPCGSMAVTFAKQPSRQETVIDLHGDLINLAMVVASEQAPALYDRLVRTLYHEDLFRAAKKEFMAIEASTPESPADVRTEHVDRAYYYFLVSWMGRNGVAGTERVNYQFAVRWTPGGGSGSKRFNSAVDSIPWWHQRLRNVAILRRDMFEALGKIEDVEGTVIYVDPPYFKDTRGVGGGSRYLHDFTAQDHDRLALTLSRFKKARVIVSYYDHARLQELYSGWTKRVFNKHKNLAVQNRRGMQKSEVAEVLLINGQSLVSGTF